MAMFVGTFSYADDVTLLAPTNMALKAMLNTCTEFAASHNLLFNASKTKCMYFNGPRPQAHGRVEFMGTAIEFLDRAELLGVSILCCDVKDRNINGSVQKFYCKVNSVLYDFKDIPCDVKTRLLDTYCLDLYGSQLIVFVRGGGGFGGGICLGGFVREIWRGVGLGRFCLW